jgi:hypothetical protein
MLLEYDGTSFGQTNRVTQIREETVSGLGNAAKVTGLAIFPRKFLQGGEDLEDRLLQRGRRFMQLQGVRVMRYSGKYEYLKRSPRLGVTPAGGITIAAGYQKKYVQHA